MIILGTNSIKAAGGFNVANSLRFNSGSSDYLSRSNGTPTSLRKYTFSAWVKKTSTAGALHTLYSNGTNGDNYMYIHYRNDTEQLEYVDIKSGEYQVNLRTNRVFRDPSAWYHVMIAVDTTQGTNTNRVKIYINGVQETSFHTATYPDQNDDLILNGSNTNIGRYTIETDRYFDGYMSEVVFVDGTQQANTDLGEFDEDSGIWKPIDVSGLTFGDNGYYLDFEDSSALGNDKAGSNNFTVNNLTSLDQSTDTCTNNFAVLNSIDKGYGTVTYVEGNLKATSSSGWNPSRGTIAVTKGKWYWETMSGNSFQIGVCSDTIDFANNANAQDLTGVTVYYNAGGGYIRTDGSQVGSTSGTFSASDVAGFALDMDNKKLSVYKNGSIIVTNTSLSTSITNVAMIFGTTNGGGNFRINFGSPFEAISSGNSDGNGYGNFEYAVPSGYFALNTKNLAEYG